MTRLLDDRQLAELSRPPRERFQAALGAGDTGAIEAILTVLETNWHGQLDRYENWVASLFAYAHEEIGTRGLIELVEATRSLFGWHPDTREQRLALPASCTAPILDAVAAGAPDQAMFEFDAATEAWRAVIDLHRDWISALLSRIYEAHGPDAVEAAHRRSGHHLLDQMMREIDRPVTDRLQSFVALLQGHFAELTLTEDDEKFTITQDPCGTCSRQVTDGVLDQEGMAVVTEQHPVTWGRGETTAYRTHVPIWHVVMARERLGAPWPVNICPAGRSDEPCQILLFKDPLDPRADAYLPGAL